MSAGPNRRVVSLLAALVFSMGLLSFAAVPLYDLFCRVTGYGGATSRADAAPAEATHRPITIRFDGSVTSDMPWDFFPAQRTMELNIGQTGLAFYTASNPAPVAIAGTAAFNVLPYAAGEYFTKIDCFCFTIQVLEPGETVQMPVTFFVDPAILDDPVLKDLREITLSYTFSTTEMPEDQLSLATTAGIQDKTQTN
jgi:cytochrome c oxidase assembly protein subunit 11